MKKLLFLLLFIPFLSVTECLSQDENRRSYSVSCSGTTKKGTICKNNTYCSNGLCFHHGGNCHNKKRLALVIGNSDYKHLSKLPNPVGDALLIAETLDSLGFEIMLETNIKTKRKFLNKIIEFGERRDSFDVGFIFYAGHGMQVDGKNYLLPTEDSLKTEEDVRQYSVGVETVMKYLTKRTGEVNVLILDACRDNPLENTRGGGVGGLAEIQAKGSLIAFSTTAGNVAKDGDGDHSIYCTSLVKNMFIEGIDMDQVFRNVRREVMEITGQGTVNYDQLTGGSFYLVESTFEKEFALIDSLVEIGENIHLSEAMELVGSILKSNPENQRVLLEKGDIYIELKDYEKALKEYNKAIKLYPNDPKCFNYRGYMYLHNTKEYEKAIADFDQCIAIDSAYTKGYSNRADVYYLLEDYQSALPDYTKAINLQKDNPYRYKSRAECYIKMEDYSHALMDLTSAIDLAPNDATYYVNRGNFYGDYKKESDLALKDYTTAIKISTNDYQTARALHNRALIYWAQEEHVLAIEGFTSAIDLAPNDVSFYIQRAELYLELEDYENALIGYNHLVDNDPQNVQYLLDRSDCLSEMKKFDLAINDLNKVLRIDSLSDKAYYKRSYINWAELERTDLGILDMSNAIKINPTDPIYFTFRAGMFQDLDSLDLVLPDLTKAIALDSNDAYTWWVRGNFYESIGDVDNAIKDRLKAIEVDSLYDFAYEDVIELYLELGDIDNAEYFHTRLITLFPENPFYYNNRADFYGTQENYDEALKDYATAIEISTDDWQTSRAINNSANIYWKEEKWELCIEEYTKAIAVSPLAVQYSNRGRVYQIIKDYDNAIIDMTKAIELGEKDPELYAYRAKCYIEMEKYTNALKDYDKAIDLAPENPLYLNNRADFYKQHQENYDEALKDYATVIEISTDDYSTARAINNRAMIYEVEEKWELAIEEYTEALTFLEHPIIYSQRASVYLELENYEKALADFTSAIDLDKENPERYDYRADCYIAMEDDTNALKDLDKAIDLAPENPDGYNNRGIFFHNQEKYDLALADFEFILKLDPTYAWAINNIARIYNEQEKHDLAIIEYTKAIELSVDDPLSYSNRGLSYRDNLEDYDKAIIDFTKAIELDKENPRRYDNRADCYIEMEDYNSALVDLSKAIDLAPDEAKWYAYRSDIYEYIKDKEKQLNDINTALDLDKEYSYAYELRGDFYVKEKDYDNAIADYLQAISFDSLSYSKSHLASCYLELEKYSKALQVLNEAIAIDSTYTSFYYYRLQCYILLGDTLKAFEDAETIISMDSLITTGYVSRGYLYRITNNNKKALDDLNHAVYLDTASSWAYNNRASYHMFIKEYELAELDYKKAISINDKDPEPYFYLSRIYKLQANTRFKALKYLNKSIDKLIIGDGTISSEDLMDDIELVTLYIERGQLYELLEAPEEMCEDYKKACDLGDCELFNKSCK